MTKNKLDLKVSNGAKWEILNKEYFATLTKTDGELTLEQATKAAKKMAPWMGKDVTNIPNFIFNKYTDVEIKQEF